MQRFLRLVFALAGAAAGLVMLLPVIVVALPFWIVAIVVGRARKHRSAGGEDVMAWRDAIQYEPVIGWKTKPNLDVRLAGPEGAFHVTTDEMGGRGPVSLDSARTVVFGDSFGFGHAADDDFFFPHRSPEERVWAFGANGYSLVQELLWMERLAKRLRGKVVVWMVFYGNDLYDNLAPNHQKYRMPFVRQTESGDWEIETSHVNSTPWPFYEVRNDQRKLAAICSDTDLTRRAMSACHFLLGKGAAACRDVGAELLVLGVPEVWQLSEEGRRHLKARSPKPEAFDWTLPDRELENICRNLGIEFIPVSRVLAADDHIVGDCHWNARGHRKIVELLASLERSGPSARTHGTGMRPSRSRQAAV